METDEIAAKSGMSVYSVQRAINKASEKAGTNSRRSLAYFLQNQGMEFAINTPTKPLVELFDKVASIAIAVMFGAVSIFVIALVGFGLVSLTSSMIFGVCR